MHPLVPIPWTELFGRLLFAIFLGAVVGLEREIGNKAAGLRTNMLVCLGVALFILAPIQTGLAEIDTAIMGRVLQGVITGVGFVGAGSIIREDRVRGLTSATAVWVSAGLGITAGLGQWQLSLISVLLAFIILRILKRIERWI